MEQLLSTREAAQFLGVTTRTLKRWRASGKLVPCVTGDRGDKFYSMSQLSPFRETFHETMTRDTMTGDTVTISPVPLYEFAPVQMSPLSPVQQKIANGGDDEDF